MDNKDRRWLVVTVTESKQSKEYWVKYNAYINDDDGRKMKHWATKLAERYGLIDEGDEAPFTDAKLDIIKAQYSEGQRMIEDVLKHIIGVYNHFRDRKQWDGAFEI